jgi:hypothetical protein
MLTFTVPQRSAAVAFTGMRTTTVLLSYFFWRQVGWGSHLVIGYVPCLIVLCVGIDLEYLGCLAQQWWP